MEKDAKRKIKVLRIIARLNIGGPAIHTILLSEGLNKDEFDTILITGKADRCEGDMFSYAKRKSVNPVIIPQLRRNIDPINDIIAFLKLFVLIKKEEPDIIHTHTAKAGALGRVAGLVYNIFNGKKRCKLIHTFHGTVLQGYFGKSKTALFVWIERTLGSFTDCIIVVSDSIKKELLSLGVSVSEKIKVVPLGLELDELLSIPEKNSEQLNIGIVGRLVPIKNHKMFLDAVRLFKDKTPEFSCAFYIIGDGELKGELEFYASKLGLNKAIKFCGWNSDMREVYSFLDIVLLTSLNEGTPLSLIEAMAAARAVIATDVGGVRDLFFKNKDYGLRVLGRVEICDNGILCKNNDPLSVAEALGILASNKELRKKMGLEGREFIKVRFSKERLIKDINLLYNTCLKGATK